MKESEIVKDEAENKRISSPEFLFGFPNFKAAKNLNYSDFDTQKGSLSPRMLFKKRKSDYNEQSQKHYNESTNKAENRNIKIANKLKESFDSLMDFVHDTYFSIDNTHDNTQNSNENSNNTTGFKFTSLDLLINPLRQKFTWETWSPYEIALFHCCICKFGPNFDFFGDIVRNFNFFNFFR